MLLGSVHKRHPCSLKVHCTVLFLLFCFLPRVCELQPSECLSYYKDCARLDSHQRVEMMRCIPQMMSPVVSLCLYSSPKSLRRSTPIPSPPETEPGPSPQLPYLQESEIRPTLLMCAGPLYKTVLVGKEKVADLCWENPVHLFQTLPPQWGR